MAHRRRKEDKEKRTRNGVWGRLQTDSLGRRCLKSSWAGECGSVAGGARRARVAGRMEGAVGALLGRGEWRRKKKGGEDRLARCWQARPGPLAGANLKLPTVARARPLPWGWEAAALAAQTDAPCAAVGPAGMRRCIEKGCSRCHDGDGLAARFCVTHRIRHRYPRQISELSHRARLQQGFATSSATMTAAAEQPARVGPAPPVAHLESLIWPPEAEAPRMRPRRVTPSVSFAPSVWQLSVLDVCPPGLPFRPARPSDGCTLRLVVHFRAWWTWTQLS